MTSPLRHLPSVEKLRRHPLLANLPDALAADLARTAIAQTRAHIVAGEMADLPVITAFLHQTLDTLTLPLRQPSLRRILNGTGVLLHTNAGRAPLPPEALEALVATARGYSNLEFSLDTGKRSSRQDHVRTLLCLATGAEDALVVNNGAASVLLALHALAAGQQVVVSRGELVEIGGGFRIPDVMTAAGASLLEVGTTNRTHLRDYARALDRDKKAQIAALLRVHRSNFALVGFTKTAELAELAELARAHHMPLIVDVGSGALQPLQGPAGSPLLSAFEAEPLIRDVLSQGADLALFSGDKLVGGPQAGIIVGRRALVTQLAQNPMARALRVDNLTLAALESVLRIHLQGRAITALPVISAVALTTAELAAIAGRWQAALAAGLDGRWAVTLTEAEAQLGGGTDPLVRLPSLALGLRRSDLTAESLDLVLRGQNTPVLGRIRGDHVWLDLRTLLAGGGPDEEVALAELVGALQ